MLGGGGVRMITCIVLQLTRFFMTVIKYITLLLRFDFAVKFALRTEQNNPLIVPQGETWL